MLALMNCLFLAEIYFGVRFRINELANGLLQTEDFYDELHGSIQEILIISIGIIALVLVMWILFIRQVVQGATRVAASLVIVVLALFSIETVSLHVVDAVFYRTIGSVMMIGWAWACAATGICLAALLQSRVRKP